MLQNATLANISFSDTKITLKRGTSAEWAAANPVLAAGEPSIETDTGIMKIGDGTTAYSSLVGTTTKNLDGDITHVLHGDGSVGVVNIDGGSP